jgi:2-haloalkanoic acid dehalogenase type II
MSGAKAVMYHPSIAMIVFDMFGTLVHNDESQWVDTLSRIAASQRLTMDGRLFHSEWSKREIQFRATRTNMKTPNLSPPFRSYWQAWHDAFAQTFKSLEVPGDAAAATEQCFGPLSKRTPFPDVAESLKSLSPRWSIGVLSNADDRYLHGVIDRNKWDFETIVSSEEARAYKPDPRIFEFFCKKARVNTNEVLYVGDSSYDDVHGAGSVGMKTVLLRRDQKTPGRTPPPDTVNLAAPHFEISSLTELYPLLIKFENHLQ